ncbi:MAG: FxLYD domain-containing protein [Coleofasciculus sp. G1-WW12-02]|uniref:FxLYD domain-containing protein n=1 Tax=Coleofasciculus sp. G1-WW12-02 TaxID=3068483 RepID=UPI0032F79F67
MLKLSSFFIANLALLLPGLIFHRPLLADTTDPGGLIQPFDAPVCYMETGDGRILDLSHLCRTQPAAPTSRCISGADGMALSQVNYNGNSLIGQVSNRTCVPVQLVRVNYQVLDNQGNPIDNGFIYAEPTIVPPGTTASFEGIVVPGVEVNVTHVEWSNTEASDNGF